MHVVLLPGVYSKNTVTNPSKYATEIPFANSKKAAEAAKNIGKNLLHPMVQELWITSIERQKLLA
ncbi:hypothetical protein AAOGI_18410 [Agarivorans albus]